MSGTILARFSPPLFQDQCLHLYCTGLDWTGLDWTGLDWTGLVWTGLDWTGLDWTGLDWTGLDWTGLDWTGLDWTGLDWTGLDWTGLDWTGLDWKRVAYCPPPGVPTADHHHDPIADSIGQHDHREVLNASCTDPGHASGPTPVCQSNDEPACVKIGVSDIGIFVAMEHKRHLCQMKFIPTYKTSQRKA